jgi:outer membrane lipoprotein-sorting protein
VEPTALGERVSADVRRWWRDGPVHRPGARRRYVTVAVAIAVLVSLPAIIGAIPVSAKKIPVATLLARVMASEQVPYTGLASASGALQLPDLGVGTDVTALLSGTNRLRAWWDGPTQYRVDRVTFAAESDVYRTGNQVWTWDSDHRIAVLTAGTPQIPLPGPQDALPGNLARRLLSQAKAADLHPAGARRIAGRTVLAMTWEPHDPRSTIGRVKVWVDEDNGLPLSVEVRSVSGGRAFSSSFLDIHFAAPNPSVLTFDPSKDKTAIVENTEPGAPDSAQATFHLPATIGGLPQRSPPRPLIATYGTGPSIVAVTALDPTAAGALREQIDSPGHPPVKGAFGTGSLIETPLVTGLVFATASNGYVLLGTVTRDQIEAMALDLVRHPAQQIPVKK